jgi:hypothetical protein
VTLDGATYLSTTLVDSEPIAVDSINPHSQGSPGSLSVVDETGTASKPTLCQGLIH